MIINSLYYGEVAQAIIDIFHIAVLITAGFGVFLLLVLIVLMSTKAKCYHCGSRQSLWSLRKTAVRTVPSVVEYLCWTCRKRFRK